MVSHGEEDTRPRVRNYAFARRDSTERTIVEYFRKCGALVIRISSRGTPDLLIGYRKRFALVECKTAAQNLTPAQKTFFAETAKRALPAYVCRDLDDAALALKLMVIE